MLILVAGCIFQPPRLSNLPPLPTKSDVVDRLTSVRAVEVQIIAKLVVRNRPGPLCRRDVTVLSLPSRESLAIGFPRIPDDTVGNVVFRSMADVEPLCFRRR